MASARSFVAGTSARHLLLACIAVGFPAVVQQAAVSSVSGAPPPPRYRVTDLGDTGGGFLPKDINEAGQVVGETGDGNGVIWKPATLNGPDGAATAIGDVSGIPMSVLHANNDSGVSGGQAYPSAQGGQGGNRAFRRATNGLITTFPDDRAEILDINTAGVTVGDALDSGTGRFRPKVFTGPEDGYLPTLEEGQGAAFSINDKSIIAGESLVFRDPGTTPHAVRWVNHTIEDIHANTLPEDAFTSHALAINNLDHIVGHASYTDGTTRGLLWTGVVSDLGSLASGNCIPDDINDSDAIVGTAGVGTAGAVAFLEEENGPVDLNTLLVPGGGYHLETATGINNAGQIICTSHYSVTNNTRGVLLTPFTLIKADVSVTLAATLK